MPAKKQSFGEFLKDNVATSFKHAIHSRSFVIVYLFHLVFFSAMIYTALKMVPSFLQLSIAQEMGIGLAAGTNTAGILMTQFVYLGVIFIIYWLLSYVITVAVLVGFDEMRRTKKEGRFLDHFVYGFYRLPTLIGIAIVSALLMLPGAILSELVKKVSLTAGSFVYDVYSIVLTLTILLAVPYAVLKKEGILSSIKKSYRAFKDNPVEILISYLVGVAVSLSVVLAFLVPVGVVLVMKLSPAISPLLQQLGGAAQQNPQLMVGSISGIVTALYQHRYWLIGGYVVGIVGFTLSYLFWASYLVGLFRRYGRK